MLVVGTVTAGNVHQCGRTVASGCDQSLRIIQGTFTNGDVSREDYAIALRSRQAYLDEIRSDQRDDAAAFGDHYKYY